MVSPSEMTRVGMAGITVEHFNQLYAEAFNHTLPFGSEYALVSYDAPWVWALALNNTLLKLQQLGGYAVTLLSSGNSYCLTTVIIRMNK